MATAMDRRFQLAEEKLKRKELQREQQEKEALQRRFASMGALGSGAAMKSEQMAAQEASKRISEGRQTIEGARLEEMARQEAIEAQRAFQRGEREAGQTFGAEQQALARQFAKEERLGGQTFGAEQQALARQFAKEERLGSQEFQAGQLKSSQEFAHEQAAKQAELAREFEANKNAIAEKAAQMQEKEFDFNKITQFFNMEREDDMNKAINEFASKWGEDVYVAKKADSQVNYTSAFRPIDTGPLYGKEASRARDRNRELSILADKYKSARMRGKSKAYIESLVEQAHKIRARG